MADEKVIIEWDLDLGNSLAEAKKMSDQLLNLREELQKNKQAQIALKEETKKAGENRNKSSADIEKLQASMRKLKLAELGIKDALAETNNLRKKSIDVMKITENSLEGLRKQTKALFAEREKLNTNSKAGAKRFAELTTKIKANNAQVQKADQAAGSYTSSIGNYKNALMGVSPVFSRQVMLLGQIKTALVATRAGLVTNVTGLKLLKTALVSTGIGALVVAFGALITFLTKTQRGMDGLSKLMSSVGAIVDVVIDRISSLGEAFTDIIGGLFDWDFDRVAKGLDGIAKSFEGIGEEIERESALASQLEEDFQKFRDSEIAFISERAKAQRDINALRVKAAEIQETDAAQALKFLEESEAITRRLITTEQNLAKEELRIAEQRLAMGESTREEIEEVENLRAKVYDQEATRLKKLVSIEKEQITLRSKAEKEAEEERESFIKELNEKRIETKQEQSDEEIALIEETNEMEIDAERLKIAQMTILGNELFENRKKIIGLISQAYNASLDNEETRTNRSYSRQQKALRKQLEDGQLTQEEFDTQSEQLEKDKQLKLYKIEKARFETNKKMALLNVAIDIASAVAKVWSQVGVAAIFAQALPIAAGLIQASIISSQEPPPPPEFGEGGDVRATVLGGKYHSAGGVNFVGSDGTKFQAEKDEGVFITKRRATQEAIASINKRHGGHGLEGGGRFFASGGSVIGTGENVENIKQIINATLRGVKIVTQVEDIQTGLIDYNESINAGVVE